MGVHRWLNRQLPALSRGSSACKSLPDKGLSVSLSGYRRLAGKGLCPKDRSCKTKPIIHNPWVPNCLWRPGVLYGRIAGRFDDLLFSITEYGGERLRPDRGWIRCVPRTPVGLVNHPVPKFNWQLPVCHGGLIRLPVLSDCACGSDKGANEWAGLHRSSGLMRARYTGIVERRACRSALREANSQ